MSALAQWPPDSALVPPGRMCYHAYVRSGLVRGSSGLAVAAGLAAPLALTVALIPFRRTLPNTDAALALIVVIVAVAVRGHRLAGYLSSLSAAVWFDFFLTRPYYELSITRLVDIETTVLLLVIGAAVTELGVWGWRQQAAAARRAGYLGGIGAAATAVAAGDSASQLIEQVCGELTALLSLHSCEFQYGVAGLGDPARLRSDGQVHAGAQSWQTSAEILPRDSDTELLVENGGLLQGRFLMRANPRARPTQEQRLVAVALADQVGAALASKAAA